MLISNFQSCFIVFAEFVADCNLSSAKLIAKTIVNGALHTQTHSTEMGWFYMMAIISSENNLFNSRFFFIVNKVKGNFQSITA